jgi:hypothetical protein
MGSFGVVVIPSSLDFDLGFMRRVKDVAVRQRVAHPAAEAFALMKLSQ